MQLRVSQGNNNKKAQQPNKQYCNAIQLLRNCDNIYRLCMKPFVDADMQWVLNCNNFHILENTYVPKHPRSAMKEERADWSAFSLEADPTLGHQVSKSGQAGSKKPAPGAN